MHRLRVAIVLLLLLPLVSWVGFRLWLANQTPEMRSSIEAFGPLEFLYVLRDTALPQAPEDRAAFGRRLEPGRGHAPWVLRSSLDGRPRILSIALAPESWLAYSTETASIQQFWRGDIDFTGPVYDDRHGREPTSRGEAYFRASNSTAWRVRDAEDAAWQPAELRWRGHGFSSAAAMDAKAGSLWLRFDVFDAHGGVHRVTEWPEQGACGGRAALARRLRVESDVPGSIALALPAELADDFESDARLISNGRETLLALAQTTRIVHCFGAPRHALTLESAGALDVGVDRAERTFAEHDCHTCHNARERGVGPAWSEISLRYAGADRTATVAQLATRIREGSSGVWGPAAMTPHPALDREQAEALARLVLASEAGEAPEAEVDVGGAEATWSFGFPSGPRPQTLHPSLTASPIGDASFTPRVGGLAWLSDGRLAVATWDQDGAVYALDGWAGPRTALRIERIADGLHEPLGLVSVGADLYVLQKQELTQLIDRDEDGRIDEYRTITNAWTTTSNFHEFAFGLAHLRGSLYGTLSVCVLNGGKSCRQQGRDRGKVFRVSLASGEIEFIASGLRTPNGVAATAEGELLVTDNQGDWLPASKLVRVTPGDFYGWRAPGEGADERLVAPPALWLPHNEVGASPTQPLELTSGPYAGHVLFGDIFNGGLKRAALEEVAGQLQGAAFHFSAGLQAPVNRMLAAPDGSIVVGQVGSVGNWGEFGKQRYGLERLHFADEAAFEPMRFSATVGGFDIEFSRPLGGGALAPEQFSLSHWFYVPSERYGGPKYGLEALRVDRVALSPDRTRVSLSVDGLEAGRVVYIEIDRALRSVRGEELWVNEAWYTLNALASGAAAADSSSALGAVSAAPTRPPTAPNTLSDAERASGWRLLFDGEGFAGWKIYGSEDDAIEGWVVEDGALTFTRDVSFAGLVWNHLNPFTTAALDLMTRERFDDFELSIDWKISPGGNSGILYLVPSEESSLSWDLALEMQVLDDDAHADGKLERHRSGDLYDLVASTRRTARPAGEWNTARIRVVGDEITHWLNGEKIVDVKRGSAAWERAMAASKFAGVEGFGRAQRGHIALQDHGDIVSYRNIKLRTLSSPR